MPRSDAAAGGGQGRRPAGRVSPVSCTPARRPNKAGRKLASGDGWGREMKPKALSRSTRRAKQRSMEAKPWGTCVPRGFLCFCHHLLMCFGRSLRSSFSSSSSAAAAAAAAAAPAPALCVRPSPCVPYVCLDRNSIYTHNKQGILSLSGQIYNTHMLTYLCFFLLLFASASPTLTHRHSGSSGNI